MKQQKKEEAFLCFETYMMMKKTRKVIEDKFSKIRKDYNLKNIDIFILYFVHWVNRNDSEQSQINSKDICEAMKLNKGQVSTALERLVENEFLEAKVSEKDKRITYYKLRTKARKLTEQLDTSINNINAKINSEMSEEDILAFKKVFICYMNNIDSILD